MHAADVLFVQILAAEDSAARELGRGEDPFVGSLVAATRVAGLGSTVRRGGSGIEVGGALPFLAEPIMQQ